ncbi:hypothetical protein A1O3_06353 [Capronia epimyces CBS 606.96]|uniref:Uncharacterized protein n=1 Tax=Capronia epimyces CBS 606.96 TaxID=1182542 RepID=W9XYT1_9EURO|nr:uncharacterized protein A1O3_06353 [Capronia epimyces CBS 606.96]EXJ82540.1 hypothetical protein A1O3_06353 [Capronia epimyces CBS 606.96]
MPNVSFDIFFDKDFINVTATRGYRAPKAKPEWKVRTLPKLPPKAEPEDPSRTPRPLPRDKLVHSRQSLAPQKQLGQATASDRADEADKTEKAETSPPSSQAGDKSKRKPPKLGPKKSTTTS